MNLCGERNTASFCRIVIATGAHLDFDVRSGGGKIPERERPMAVEQATDPVGVANDPGDVASGAERADLQCSIAESLELFAQGCLINMAVSVLGNPHDIADRFAPGQFVAVVLKRTNEDNWSHCAESVR